MDEIMKLDLYELLNIPLTADEKEIKKAYRKKALTCHPDKNPDNPKAAQLFQELSKALEILTDTAARSAYNQLLKARKATVIRNRELDSKRKKLKEDLEARERASQEVKINDIDAAKKLQHEIDRLRKEGSKQLEEERELLRQQIFEEKQKFNNSQHEDMKLPRLKAKWKVQKGDVIDGGYSHEVLQNIFKKHGQVTCLVLSSRKRGSAIVEFATVEAAQSAFESEVGLSENPLALSWICGQPEKKSASEGYGLIPTSKGPPPVPEEGSSITSRDYESVVLMKLRQAEERKRLIQQLMEEDDV